LKIFNWIEQYAASPQNGVLIYRKLKTTQGRKGMMRFFIYFNKIIPWNWNFKIKTSKQSKMRINKNVFWKYNFYLACKKVSKQLFKKSFDNIWKRLQVFSVIFHQIFYKVSSIRIVDILLFQSCFKNIANIFCNFCEMFHFSVEIFLRYLWKIRCCTNIK